MKAPLKTAKMRQLPDGTLQALSSDGSTVYTVAIGAQPSCNCPAGNQGHRCYHVTTATGRYAALWPFPKRFRRPLRRAQVSDLYV